MSAISFPKDKIPIVVSSHPRSGTHLCIDFLRRQYKECNIPNTLDRGLDDLYFSIEGLFSPRRSFEQEYKKGLRVMQSCNSPIVKYHGYSEEALKKKFPEWMEYLSEAKTIYVYRNIYQVMCSTYIYMQTFENSGKGVSLSSFIRQPIWGAPSRVDFWVNEINKYKQKEGVLLLKYDDIIAAPENVLDRLDVFLGMSSVRKLPLLPPKNYSKWKMRYQRFFSINPDNTAILASHKGVNKFNPKTAFSKEDILFINGIATNTIESLGYSLLIV